MALPPPGVEVIDVDALPDCPDVQAEETVKQEEVAVKKEPGFSYSPFATFTNTKDDPIILDDEDEPLPSVDLGGRSLIANSTDDPINLDAEEAPSTMELDGSLVTARPVDPVVVESENQSPPRTEFGGSSLTARPRMNLGVYKETLRSIQQQWARTRTFNGDEAESSTAPAGVDVDMDDAPADTANLFDEEGSDDEDRLKFIEARTFYEQKKEAGQATNEDDIRFERLRRQEQIRLRKRREDRRSMISEDHDNFLFVQQDEEVGQPANPFHDDNINDGLQDEAMEEDDDPEHVDHEETLCSTKAKKRAERATAKSNDSKKRDPKSQKASVQDKDARVRKSGPAKGEKQGRKRKQPAQPKLADIGSLLTGNLLRDHASNQGKSSLPRLTATNRQDALKNLIASLPEEERKAAKSDKKYLDEAIRAFKQRTIRVSKETESDVPAFLKLKGLRCDLKPHQVMGK
jgi:hypothetical protein